VAAILSVESKFSAIESRSAEGAMPRQFYVYILCSSRKILYVGVTNNLQRRLYQHREGTGSSFCAKYHVRRLVHFETTGDPRSAIAREKQIKGWSRAKKIALIAATNPRWRDLSKAWDRPTVRHRGPASLRSSG
jgi:putative endonuclease